MFRSFRYALLFLVALAVLHGGAQRFGANTAAQTEEPAGAEIATAVANEEPVVEPTAPADDSIVIEPDGTVTIPAEPRDNSGAVALIVSVLVALFTVASNTGTLWVVFRRFMPAMPILISAADFLAGLTPGDADNAEVKKWRDWYNATHPQGTAAKLQDSALAQSVKAVPPLYKNFGPIGGQVPDEDFKG